MRSRCDTYVFSMYIHTHMHVHVYAILASSVGKHRYKWSV